MGEWVNGGEHFINSYGGGGGIEIVCENRQLFHPFTYFSPIALFDFDLNIRSLINEGSK